MLSLAIGFGAQAQIDQGSADQKYATSAIDKTKVDQYELPDEVMNTMRDQGYDDWTFVAAFETERDDMDMVYEVLVEDPANNNRMELTFQPDGAMVDSKQVPTSSNQVFDPGQTGSVDYEIDMSDGEMQQQTDWRAAAANRSSDDYEASYNRNMADVLDSEDYERAVKQNIGAGTAAYDDPYGVNQKNYMEGTDTNSGNMGTDSDDRTKVGETDLPEAVRKSIDESNYKGWVFVEGYEVTPMAGGEKMYEVYLISADNIEGRTLYISSLGSISEEKVFDPSRE